MVICVVGSVKTIQIYAMNIALWILGMGIVVRMAGKKIGSLRICDIFNANVDRYTIRTLFL